MTVNTADLDVRKERKTEQMTSHDSKCESHRLSDVPLISTKVTDQGVPHGISVLYISS